MIIDEDDYLKHYGILRRSGRYPWGSGGNAEQNHRSFMGMVKDFRAQGMSEAEIARAFDISTTDLRALKSIANNEIKAADMAMAYRLKYERGMSNQAIAEKMGLAGESSVRSLLAPARENKADKLQATADMLKQQIEDGGYLDVGTGTELYLGISDTQLKTALAVLKNDGYVIEKVQVDQLGTKNKTVIRVLAKEGTEYSDIVKDLDSIKSIAVKYDPDTDTYISATPPKTLDSKRVKVVYDEDGGSNADGAIYIRPGVEDLSLGGAQYAQVRINVDDSHYLKGMAIYKDDMPAGVDVIFNTNKTNTGNKLDAMKKLNRLPEVGPDGKAVRDEKGEVKYTNNVDWENPFGATIKPGGQRGVLNVVNEEGDWDKWSKNLASQMLSKQKPTLAKEQLDKTYSQKKSDLDEIMALTNPAVKKRLLEAYADDVDSASVHLKAAHMPRQATKVILPVEGYSPENRKGLKDTEIYAPSFREGERVALVRYPHGGTFEIPELTVTHRNPVAKGLLKNAKDAVGINARVAERMSGADFDGDFVLVIPNNAGKVQSKSALEGLKYFNPKDSYPAYEGMKKMTPKQKQTEMGKVSNLITDMTIRGANDHEIAKAVRHSMVVIDAEKHNLNYKQSHIDNGIASLKAKYQGKSDAGASTLISRTTSTIHIPKVKNTFKINPETGEKIYTPAGESYLKRKQLKVTDPKTGRKVGAVDAQGRKIYDPDDPGVEEFRTTKTTKGAATNDAHTLSSGTRVEKVYADHSNRLKALGNQARKTMVNTQTVPYSPSAKKIYNNEVKTLDAKLNVALKNAPRERQAQVIANAIVKQKRDANPEMDSDEVKKISSRALATARARTQASKQLVDITDREWEAIQAGAVSNNKLTSILNNTNLDRVKELATPRKNPVMTDQKQQRARQLLASGRTSAEVADILGVAVSTLNSSME